MVIDFLRGACLGILALCGGWWLGEQIRSARAKWALRFKPQPSCPHCTEPAIDCVPQCDHYYHTCDELGCTLARGYPAIECIPWDPHE